MGECRFPVGRLSPGVVHVSFVLLPAVVLAFDAGRQRWHGSQPGGTLGLQRAAKARHPPACELEPVLTPITAFP